MRFGDPAGGRAADGESPENSRHRAGLWRRLCEVTTDGQSQPQIEAIPGDAPSPFAEARVALKIAPWSGEWLIAARPDSGLRTLTSGLLC